MNDKLLKLGLPAGTLHAPHRRQCHAPTRLGLAAPVETRHIEIDHCPVTRRTHQDRLVRAAPVPAQGQRPAEFSTPTAADPPFTSPCQDRRRSNPLTAHGPHPRPT